MTRKPGWRKEKAERDPADVLADAVQERRRAEIRELEAIARSWEGLNELEYHRRVERARAEAARGLIPGEPPRAAGPSVRSRALGGWRRDPAAEAAESFASSPDGGRPGATADGFNDPMAGEASRAFHEFERRAGRLPPERGNRRPKRY